MVDETYPWYNFINNESIEQGDLFFNFPVIEPVDHIQLDTEQTPEVIVKDYDVVVMTQSCDIAEDKVDHIILCPHFDIEGRIDISKSSGENTFNNIKAGRQVRYSMLNNFNSEKFKMNYRIVDFGLIFTASKGLVNKIVKDQNPRLRLCPPYREHLAQGFAKFFMRVGLPQNIQLPES